MMQILLEWMGMRALLPVSRVGLDLSLLLPIVQSCGNPSCKLRQYFLKWKLRSWHLLTVAENFSSHCHGLYVGRKG
eukprot:CCRYP_015379-RA/>CCRYP_015379-RA protein AED:0.32 eAED:1.00 QI:0/-1/0/1/-1/0/1/0/75